jgi:aerobic carbon-monoxide dehydrogenase medium subunit
MKPAHFDYVRPATVEEALRLLAGTPNAKILAGGQTLGPMLNLRLVQPALLIDITRIAQLAGVEEDSDAITLGATVTHASIEDERVKDPTGGFLSTVARGVAYRAVRTRGTIGGSLAHADPAADWLSALVALDAHIVLMGPGGLQRIALVSFVRGALETALVSDQIIIGIRIPKLSRQARCGYHKICRKRGDFAEAIGVAVRDPELGLCRLVVSTTSGAPVVLASHDWSTDTAMLRTSLAAAGFDGDTYERNLHVVALQRAMLQVLRV